MQKKCLLVSAFYDINRSSWKSYKRSKNTYFSYFEFWARMKGDLVVFCETEECKKEILKSFFQNSKWLNENTPVMA